MFNPLYIHAGVGLGKTHLLQAITWAGNANGDRKVLYLTAERFMYGFVSALKNQNAIAYKEALRGIDVLVIDDLQFLTGKNMQAEFCHTLNALIDAGRQVVIAADRPPCRSRNARRPRAFAARRRACGRNGSARRGIALRNPEEPDHRRARASSGLRSAGDRGLLHLEVRSPITAAISKARSTACWRSASSPAQPVTMEVAEREVKDLIRPQEPKRVKIEDIQRVVARQYNVSRSDLLSSRRTANVVRPRQVAMYLAKTLTLRSLPEIGRRFGGRDHTTVLHAVRKIENLIGNDTSLADEIDSLKRMLQD